MRDQRWEPDTVFLVFEEDYRFAADDDLEPVVVKARTLQEVVGEVVDDAPETRVPLGAEGRASPPLWFFQQTFACVRQLSPPPLS